MFQAALKQDENVAHILLIELILILILIHMIGDVIVIRQLSAV